MVVHRPRRHRDARQAHYTSSPHIAGYMARLLAPEPGDLVWEPSAGTGDLVAAVFRQCAHVQVVATDSSEDACRRLKARFGARVAVHCENALTENLPDGCTKVIANPPYGAWQEPDQRKFLAELFPGLYVRDTYAVFVYRSFEALKEGGRMVAIVPETFLWLHRHEFLRRHLVEKGTFEEVARFPSHFFPGISFGYAQLCIVSIKKRRAPVGWRIRMLQDFKSPQELDALGRCNSPCTEYALQADVAARADCSFAQLSPLPVETVPLGEIAQIKTGFYSGNDRRWVRRRDSSVPRSTMYSDVDPSAIYSSSINSPPPLSGLEGTRTFIPIVRGGQAFLAKPTSHYVDWSTAAVAEYRRRGKNPARFQNSGFYFEEGIGVPMVSSKRVTAALLERRLFDQGIVGVFPNEPEMLWYLLGFLNTRLATALIRSINPTANNSANYMKKVPTPLVDRHHREKVSSIARRLHAEASRRRLQPRDLTPLDDLFGGLAKQVK